uniref:Uncharacterized protein n=1 Tax=Timema tahoe TaxID=61484 RepID=A0A7R9FK50_9NEOP|nr:unnamed protein product [Timema tahoe]
MRMEKERVPKRMMKMKYKFARAVYIFKFLFCIHIPEDDEGPYLPTTQNSYLAVAKKRSKNIQDKEYVLGKKIVGLPGETQEQGECGWIEIPKKCMNVCGKTRLDRVSNEWVLKGCDLKENPIVPITDVVMVTLHD